jgi:high-affinity iron transporter
MLPTFVIGLREGLEAALIVGIIAAFLRKQGRRDLLGWVLVGVGSAVLLCVAVGVALDAYSKTLPQKQQEGLETVIGILAVGMVTYMVVWMRRNSRQLKGQLEGMTADAIAVGSDTRAKALRAMIAMAFLAVIREGFETVVFLLAAFNESGSGASAGAGAVLGIVVAIGLGYGIYRGGVRLNLSKFFRATGLVLVLVAAGLAVNALHTAHEAGWLDAGQGRTVDLSWLVKPGTVQASLLTGMLGIQSHPVVIEVLGWLVYLIPVGCYVAWPPGKAVPARALARVAAGTAVVLAATAAVLAIVAPARPASGPTTAAGGVSARVVDRSAEGVTLRTEAQAPVAGTIGAPATFRLAPLGGADRAGLATETFQATLPSSAVIGRPAKVPAGELARLNGGRLPIGLGATSAYPVAYRSARTLTVWVEPRTDRVIDLAWSERITASLRTSAGAQALPVPVAQARSALPAPAVAGAAARARAAHATLDDRSLLQALAWGAGVGAALSLLAAAGLALAGRRRRPAEAVSGPVGSPAEAVARS